MSPLIQIIIVAGLGVIGNIVYFEYRTRKEKSKDILKQRLTNLLLPLYITLHLDKVREETWSRTENGDWVESDSNLPSRVLLPVEKIIRDNLYLADEEMHTACVEFLEWAYGSDTNERFQSIMNGKFDSAVQDKDFKKFYDIVISQYNDTRRQYLNK